MPKAVIKKYEHSQFARYSITDQGGAMLGGAQHRLGIAWTEPIDGEIDGLRFRLTPSLLKAVALPVGAPMSIDANGQQVGTVRVSTPTETASFGGEKTYHVDYCQQHYSAFHVGLGRKGQYLCVYQTPVGHDPVSCVFDLPRPACPLVAQISLPTTIKNWQPHYELSAIDKQAFMVGCQLALYYSYSVEDGWLSRTQGATKKQIKLSFRRVKSLYDPSFDERI